VRKKSADIYINVIVGNGSSLAAWVREQRPSLGGTLSEECKKKGSYSPACMHTEGATTFSWDATAGIACSDGPGDRLSQSKEVRTYSPIF